MLAIVERHIPTHPWQENGLSSFHKSQLSDLLAPILRSSNGHTDFCTTQYAKESDSIAGGQVAYLPHYYGTQQDKACQPELLQYGQCRPAFSNTQQAKVGAGQSLSMHPSDIVPAKTISVPNPHTHRDKGSLDTNIGMVPNLIGISSLKRRSSQAKISPLCHASPLAQDVAKGGLDSNHTPSQVLPSASGIEQCLRAELTPSKTIPRAPHLSPSSTISSQTSDYGYESDASQLTRQNFDGNSILRSNPRRSGVFPGRRPPSLPNQKEASDSFVTFLMHLATALVASVWPNSAYGRGISLFEFISESLRRSKTSYSTLQVALFYIIMLKPNLPGDRFTQEQTEDLCQLPLQCGRRMFLSVLMLASKYLQDKNYSTTAWSKITGLTCLEINKHERMVLQALDYRLHVPKDTFAKWNDLVIILCQKTRLLPPLVRMTFGAHQQAPAVWNTFVDSLDQETFRDQDQLRDLMTKLQRSSLSIPVYESPWTQKRQPVVASSRGPSPLGAVMPPIHSTNLHGLAQIPTPPESRETSPSRGKESTQRQDSHLSQTPMQPPSLPIRRRTLSSSGFPHQTVHVPGHLIPKLNFDSQGVQSTRSKSTCDDTNSSSSITDLEIPSQTLQVFDNGSDSTSPTYSNLPHLPVAESVTVSPLKDPRNGEDDDEEMSKEDAKLLLHFYQKSGLTSSEVMAADHDDLLPAQGWAQISPEADVNAQVNEKTQQNVRDILFQTSNIAEIRYLENRNLPDLGSSSRTAEQRKCQASRKRTCSQWHDSAKRARKHVSEARKTCSAAGAKTKSISRG